jgi:hypothetical protein
MTLDPSSDTKNEYGVELRQISDDLLWDSFLKKSAQNSVYLSSRFLDATDLIEFRYMLYIKNEPVLGCLLPPEILNGIDSLSYCMYQGLFFVETEKGSYADDNKRVRSLYELTKSLTEMKFNGRLSLHPSIVDIRGIEWYLYDHGLESTMRSKIRYTGLIDLEKFGNFAGYSRTIRKVRIQELSDERSTDNRRFTVNTNIPSFLEIYKEMFAYRDQPIGIGELSRVEAIISKGIESGFGKLLLLEELDSTPIAGVFVITDSNTDYYQFGATNPLKRGDKASTKLLGRVIEESFSQRKRQFDMVGMNSPGRGEYKSSFNARVKPYFELQFRNSK